MNTPATTHTCREIKAADRRRLAELLTETDMDADQVAIAADVPVALVLGVQDAVMDNREGRRRIAISPNYSIRDYEQYERGYRMGRHYVVSGAMPQYVPAEVEVTMPGL